MTRRPQSRKPSGRPPRKPVPGPGAVARAREPKPKRPERPRPPRPEKPPLRAGRNVYIVQTQPGFESIAWEEVAARVEGARLIGFRTVPERAGMAVFAAPRPDKLSALRTAEDVFAMLSYRRGLGPESGSLDKIESSVRTALYLEDALQARIRITPGTRAGRRLRFKVITRLAGEHEFRRAELKRAVETGILGRGDRTWRLDETAADVEFWTTMLQDEWMLAVRLSDDRMRQREYKIAHLPGSLRPAVAAALAWLSSPRDDDVVLDPLCGAATVLIERAHLGRYAMLLGGDSDRETLEAARENVGPRYKPIELKLWDAVALPLRDSSVTKIVTNLPWGIRHGSHAENRRLYPRLLAEFARVLKPDGVMVMLTAEARLMRELWRDGLFKPARVMHVTVLGVPAAVYVCPRTAISVPEKD